MGTDGSGISQRMGATVGVSIAGKGSQPERIGSAKVQRSMPGLCQERQRDACPDKEMEDRGEETRSEADLVGSGRPL